MNKERLKKIKESIVICNNGDTRGYSYDRRRDVALTLINEHGDFLIEQAKQIEKWNDYNNKVIVTNVKLKSQNKRYRKAMEQCLTEGDFECIHEQLERIVTTLSEALEDESE